MNKSAGRDKLILFDIDGTLLASGGAGEHALRLAARDHFGVEEDLAGIEIHGRTDSGIARQIFRKHGVEATTEALTGFYDLYLQNLEKELPRRKGRLLPGILELLEKLRDHPRVALALLTGNLSAGAKLKLSHYGVWEFFEFGAFADDHEDRNQLGAFAQTRARERHGRSFEPANTFVIGDTPHDIDCGRAFGARTIAIATGGYSREELQRRRPEFLFDDLSDVPAVIKLLGL